MDIVEQCAGPHEWGYRDVTDGQFIRDDAPFTAAEEITRLRETLRGLLRYDGGIGSEGYHAAAYLSARNAARVALSPPNQEDR